MEFRHEIKHEINYSDLLIIRHRLRTVAYPDPHAVDGKYLIRSLYFDNLADKALMEKVNGFPVREKFRIRYITAIHRSSIWKRKARSIISAISRAPR